MAENSLLSPALEAAALSDPRNYRLVFMFFSNNECNISVQACFDVGAMTYNVNADTTNILCTNLCTGKDEVVAIIEGGATREVSFELSRYLPLSKRSLLLRLAKENCGLRIYLIRGTRCINPLSVDEFDVMQVIGGVLFTSAYTTTELISKSISGAAEIEESVTVTGYDIFETAKQNWAIRGGATVNPIVDIKFCDTQICGGLCDEDSDGCQVIFWVDDQGMVWYSTDQLDTENLSGVITTDPGNEDFTPGVVHELCCIGDRVAVIVEELDDATGLVTVGAIYTTLVENILLGTQPTWDKTQVSTLGIDTTNLPIIEACASVCGPDTQDTIWLVGENGFVGQFDYVTGLVTVVTAIPNVVETYNDIAIKGDRIIIGGTNGIFLTSTDGGRSFQQIEIIDPNTQATFAGEITSVEILLDTNWEIGISGGRIMYTLDEGSTWYDHIQPMQQSGGGAINDIAFFKDTLIGYSAKGSLAQKAYYGSCRPYVELPESDMEFPEFDAINAIDICDYDPDVVLFAGGTPGGTGMIVLGTPEEA